MPSSDSPALSRRRFATLLGTGVAGAIVAPTIWIPRTAHAADKVTKIQRGKRGTTIYMKLDDGPFPAPGERYKDNTCIAFVPHHFRLMSDSKVDTVLHFHGHNNTAEGAMKGFALREQLLDSKQNAILIMPQGPKNARDSSGGKLEEKGALNSFLREVRQVIQTNEVAAKLGKAGIPKSARIGTLCVSAHSGGFHVAAKVATHGGFDVREVYLLDALYGDVYTFRDWVKAKKGVSSMYERHKLVSYYNKGKVKANNEKLMSELERLGIKYAHEKKEGELTPAEFTKARAVFVKTNYSHARLAYQNNSLTYCLHASALRRRLKSDWYDRKDKPRGVDERE